MTRPARLDPIVVPFDAPTERRTAALRQRIETIADPRDVIGDTDRPAVARRARTLTEAMRAYADAAALDGPDHGAAQAAAIDADRDREDPAVVAVAEMLTGSPEERRHRAREILTVVRLLESRAALAREVADVGRAIDDRTIVREAFERANVKHATAHHYAAIAVEALRRAGRLA